MRHRGGSAAIVPVALVGIYAGDIRFVVRKTTLKFYRANAYARARARVYRDETKDTVVPRSSAEDA